MAVTQAVGTEVLFVGERESGCDWLRDTAPPAVLLGNSAHPVIHNFGSNRRRGFLVQELVNMCITAAEQSRAELS